MILNPTTIWSRQRRSLTMYEYGNFFTHQQSALLNQHGHDYPPTFPCSPGYGHVKRAICWFLGIFSKIIWSLVGKCLGIYNRYTNVVSIEVNVKPVLRGHIWDKEKWSFKTGSIIKEVQFIWHFLWQNKEMVTF